MRSRAFCSRGLWILKPSKPRSSRPRDPARRAARSAPHSRWPSAGRTPASVTAQALRASFVPPARSGPLWPQVGDQLADESLIAREEGLIARQAAGDELRDLRQHERENRDRDECQGEQIRIE